MSEFTIVKQASLWAVGVVVGLIAATFLLRSVGFSGEIKLSPEGLVSGQ